MTTYWHKSIVNGEEVYRVWMNGDLKGQFKTEQEAVKLYHYLLATQTEQFKNAIIEAYNQGRISTLKERFVSAEDYFNRTFEIL